MLPPGGVARPLRESRREGAREGEDSVPCPSGSATRALRAKVCLCVNKALLKHNRAHTSTFVSGGLHTMMAELDSCSRLYNPVPKVFAISSFTGKAYQAHSNAPRKWSRTHLLI